MTEFGMPCGLCAVRPDVACRHRPADPEWTTGRTPVDNGVEKPKGGRPREFDDRASRKPPAKLAGRDLTETTLLAKLRNGPVWTQSLTGCKPIYEDLIKRGVVERCRPPGGQQRNMIRLVE